MILSLADERIVYKVKEDVHKLINRLTEDIETINITGNVFQSEALREFFKEFKKIRKLKKLIASKIFSALPREELLLSLDIIGEFVEPKYLEELDLSENAISAVLPEKFFNLLTNADQLKVLKINNCGLGPIGGKNLARALDKINNKARLEYIDISKNKLDVSATEIGKTLTEFTNLKTIKIQYNTIPRKNMDDFIVSFEHHFLKSLDLRDNFLSVEGCRNLGKYFVYWETEELFLGDCLIGDDGLEAFVLEAIKKISKKEAKEHKEEKSSLVLDISYNDISQKGIDLLEKYSKDIVIEKLMIYGNEYEDCSALVGYISKNKGIVVYEDPNETETNVIDESFLQKFASIL